MESIKFISGNFTPSEAQEVLLDAINKKINFYNLKNFTSQVRYDEPDPVSEVRMEELREARARILEVIQVAKEESRDVVIESAILVATVSRNQNAVVCSEAEAC